jgi:hypothetical protein
VLQLNEHIVESGDIVFRRACKLGLEGIVSKRKELTLPFRPLTGLAQNECKCTGREARGRRGLGPMSERKLQPWMRREQALIWTAVAAVLSMVVAGVAYLALP